MYKNDFSGEGWNGKSGWALVQSEFKMEEPEPEEVIIADYRPGDYCGDADVLYRNGDTYYYATGGHCSCYGLEGQWAPEPYTKETLLGQVERANYGFFKDEAETIRKALA